MVQSLSAGIQTGWTAARRVFEEPTEAHVQRSWTDLTASYALLWAYYNNSLFDRTAQFAVGLSTTSAGVWAMYKSVYQLYRNIRLIYNPTRRLVDFYAGQVYPGVLSIDGKNLPDGVSPAIPLAPDTSSELLAAIGQFWQWSNWQAKKSVLVRYGAALGSVLVEVVDDLDHGKVAANIVWPGFVSDLTLDIAGNVKSYAVDYIAQDERGMFSFRKEIDGKAFRYFRDGNPYNYGDGQVVTNPYGFVPAVWIKHHDTGSDIGSPAIAGSLPKIDELNNIVSHIHDQIHKVVGAPVIMWSSGNVANLFNNTKRTSELIDTPSDQENVLMLKGPPDGHLDHLAGNLPLQEAAAYVDRLTGEIEQDHPELVFYRELRSMSQVTGPAASRLVGDVASRVSEVAASYDQQLIKLFQMACAIGGYRAGSGAWGILTRQQQKFIPFDLESYERGSLDIEIMPRPVLVPTRYERALEKQAVWNGVGLAVKAGVPLPVVLKDEGWTDSELAALPSETPVVSAIGAPA